MEEKIEFPIKMYDPTREYRLHKENIDQAVQNVLNHGMFVNGPEVKELENRLSEYTKSKHAICVSNGTDAITLALLSLNIGLGDEVITVPYTWISTVEVISLIGAKPVFCDINKKTFNMDETKIEKLITEKTKAILCVSLFGQCSDMDKINEIAKKHNIYVIEDAAQSFGAAYKGKKSCNLSDIATTSFFPTKPLGCYGDGGAVFTNDDKIAEKIRALKNHGCLVRYQHKYIGFNARLDSIQGAILNEKIKYIENTLNNRRKVAQFYYDNLKNCKDLILPHIESWNVSVFAQFSILAKNKEERDKIVKYLRDNKINVEIFYPISLHLQECFSYLEYKKGDFLVSEEIADRVFNLPCYGELLEDELKYICDLIMKY